MNRYLITAGALVLSEDRYNSLPKFSEGNIAGASTLPAMEKLAFSSKNDCEKWVSPFLFSQAFTYRIKDRRTITKSVYNIKAQIARYKRPVIISIKVDTSFGQLGDNEIYKKYTGPSRGNHAITIVGYDNAKYAFKIMNSWGQSWAAPVLDG